MLEIQSDIQKPIRAGEVLKSYGVEENGPVFELLLESGSALIYEPHHSKLFWKETGEPVSLARVGRQIAGKEYCEAWVTSPERPLGKSRDLEKVKITLGMACNYTCSYCSQAAHRVREEKPTQTVIETLVEKLVNLIGPKSGKGIQFELWGGEPMLYWDSFRTLTLKLKEHYPQAQMMTVTNGSLLNDERVDFLIEHDFIVGVSHDGPGYHLRGKDPLDNPQKLDLIRRLAASQIPRHKFSFNCVLTENNHSLYDIYTHLEQRLGQSFMLSTEGVVSYYSKVQSDVGPKGWEHMQTMWRRIYTDLIRELPNGRPLITQLCTSINDLNKFFGTLAGQRPASALGQKCGMDLPRHISVNLKGEVSTCQNVTSQTGHGIGHLDQFDKIELKTAKSWVHHANCRNCPVVQLCQGSCMYLMGDDRRPTCDAHFVYYAATLMAGLYMLTDQRVVEIRSDRVRIEGMTSLAM